MNCPTCNNKLIQLLFSAVCDYCDSQPKVVTNLKAKVGDRVKVRVLKGSLVGQELTGKLRESFLSNPKGPAFTQGAFALDWDWFEILEVL
jgi:formylmethanofuran dehydrogenase subunit D